MTEQRHSGEYELKFISRIAGLYWIFWAFVSIHCQMTYSPAYPQRADLPARGRLSLNPPRCGQRSHLPRLCPRQSTHPRRLDSGLPAFPGAGGGCRHARARWHTWVHILKKITRTGVTILPVARDTNRTVMSAAQTNSFATPICSCSRSIISECARA